MPSNKITVQVDGYLLLTILNDPDIPLVEHEVKYIYEAYHPEDSMGGNESIEIFKPDTISHQAWARIKSRVEEDAMLDAYREMKNAGQPLPYDEKDLTDGQGL